MPLALPCAAVRNTTRARVTVAHTPEGAPSCRVGGVLCPPRCRFISGVGLWKWRSYTIIINVRAVVFFGGGGQRRPHIFQKTRSDFRFRACISLPEGGCSVMDFLSDLKPIHIKGFESEKLQCDSFLLTFSNKHSPTCVPIRVAVITRV